jgi:hypothetical protein
VFAAAVFVVAMVRAVGELRVDRFIVGDRVKCERERDDDRARRFEHEFDQRLEHEFDQRSRARVRARARVGRARGGVGAAIGVLVIHVLAHALS